MNLNKFIDKTLEAAKQSALQIYGDDYSHLKNAISGDDEKSNGNQQQDARQKEETNASAKKQPKKSTAKQGVVFERSTSRAPSKEKQAPDTGISKKLDSIRRYAAEQSNDDAEAFGLTDTKQKSKEPISSPNAQKGSHKSSNQLYSRKDLRPNKNRLPSNVQPRKTAAAKEQSAEEDQKHGPRYDTFTNELPDGVTPIAEMPMSSDNTTQENSADLHKRLDRLESLVHLALSVPDAPFSDHPLLHKLVHKGVAQKLIRNWFETIAQQGVNPEQKPELFCSKLLGLIKDLLQQSKAEDAGKVLLFTGRSGAGKTHLMMKLAANSHFMGEKNVALALVMANGQKNKYSILEPFCNDHDIDFFSIQNADQAADYDETWTSYDHVLIDTPALDTGGSSVINAIDNLKKTLQSHGEIETHYLVNTALNGIAFNDPLAQEISADHIALTHIDQSSKWGQTVQLIANTQYKLRYISSGPAIEGDLLPFNPKKFARKLLRS